MIKGERYMIKKIKRWYWKRRVMQAAEVLARLDGALTKAGIERHQRKRFWKSMQHGSVVVRSTLKEILST
jgi:hypothetical protein